jgi:hypothetical protein
MVRYDEENNRWQPEKIFMRRGWEKPKNPRT